MVLTVRPAMSGRTARIVLVAALMFGLAIAGIELTRVSGRIASVWLANGAVLALLMRSDRREWPALMFATLATNVAANLVSGDSLLTAAVLAFCNLVEIAVMAILLGRMSGERSFGSTHSIFRFGIYAAATPILSGLIAAAYVAPSIDSSTAALFGQWYLADVLGLWMVTPVVLFSTGRWTLPSSRMAILEPIAFLLVTGVLSAVMFSAPQSRLFLLCPVLLIAGFRLPTTAASLVAALSAVIATAFTLSGQGPIAAAGTTPQSQILLLQAYFLVGLILTIPVSAITGQRKRLELALIASERQFRLAAEASPAGILQCRLDGSPIYLNARWTQLTGMDIDDVRVRGWESIIQESDRGRGRALWQQVRGKFAEAIECLPCDLPGRDSGWAEILVTPERDFTGSVVGWVVRLLDVSDRVDASRALKESEALYRLLAENTRDIIMRLALDGTKLFVSRASESMLGIKPETMVGKPISAFIHPDDWAEVDRSIKALVPDDARQAIRYRKRRSNERYLWVEAVYHLVRDPTSGVPVEIVASVRDIDLRQKAELVAAEAAQKQWESNRLLTMAEELAVVGHWHVDVSADSLELSAQATDMAGLVRSGCITPAAAMDLVAPADRWRVKRAVVTAIRRRSTANCRVGIVRPDGGERFIEVAVQSEHSGDGAFAGLFGVVQDVTQKVVDERKLVDALGEARAAANAKSLFLATMRVEIRTPMTGVLGMIDLLRDNPSDHDRDNFLATLKQSAALLMAVLNDVLDFSKMEHHSLEIHKCDFDFEALAQGTLDLFFNAASQKELLITLALDPGSSAFVHGDPVRIQQVMSNLINNAIKFTDSGSVVIRVKARPGDRGEQIWRVEVRDTGIGISPEQIGNLFDPFTQAEDGTGRRFGGTGLGLAISQRLVVAMGGTLGVESRPKRGSTFWFELSLGSAVAPLVDVRPERAVGPATRALKVLVAEDNPVNQLLITALLRRQGHIPTCVDDGLKAVDAACAAHFDCILMDMQMPVMDGITATRTIRQSSGPCADTPIIALTADASSERRRFYDNAGLTDFMTKPIDSNALASKLAAIAAPPVVEPLVQRIDHDHLGRLRSALGPTRFDALLALFMTELDQRPVILREHLLAGRIDQAREEAHSIKGAALSVGAVRLGNAALAIERSAAQDDIKVNVGLIDELDAAVAATRAALEPPMIEGGKATRANA